MGPVDEICRLRGDVVPLRVHVVLGHIIYLDRAEGAKSHVERHIGEVHALVLNLLQELLCEVQACGRCGGGAVVLRIDRLIHVRILKLVGDVGRQRHLAEAVQDLLKDAVIVELHEAVSVLHDLQDLRGQGPVAEGDLRTGAKLLSGLYQGLPDIALSAL